MPSALVGATPLHGRQPWPWYGARPSHRSQQGQASRLLLRPLGKTGRIGLHEDDDPRQLARSFARTYQLDAMMRERLQQLIERYESGCGETFRAARDAWAAPDGRYMDEVVPGLAAQCNAAPSTSDISSEAVAEAP